MQINLQTNNNIPMAFYPNVTLWDQTLNLTYGIIRMQMRQAVGDVNVLYEWSTANGKIKVQKVQAAGSLNFTALPANGQTITIGTTTITFVTSGATGNQVNIGSTIQNTLNSLVTFLQGSADSQLSQCNYAALNQTLGIAFKIAGTAGNNFNLSTTTTAVVSSATLTGGGTQLYVLAPITDIAAFVGDYPYDCRFEGQFNECILFGGTITFNQGITQ